MTNHLNHFRIFGQNGGYNKNPKARTIRTSIKSNCALSLCIFKGINFGTTQKYDNSVRPNKTTK